MSKTITFGVPCYNSAEYMDTCISSIIDGSDAADDVQLIIVDDGSTKDDTFAKAQEWETRYPTIVKAVHQENGGHGIAVLKALSLAEGTYFKIVDSDDWLDAAALKELLANLRGFVNHDVRIDLVISNYVYEHVEDARQTFVDYRFALKPDKILTWHDIGHFTMSQNLLMHSLCYRTDILQAGGIPMPAHTFYVDNIYAYVPLPRCKTLYYLDIDLYRYFIGREDQSVNEKVMASRIDQQIRITRIMMHAYHLYDDIDSFHLRSYMVGYFTMMMALCSIFSRLSDKPNAMAECKALWDELREYDSRMYRRASKGVLGLSTNLPTKTGEKVTIGLYRFAQKLVKFN
ncbi:MAG: glycosyltransferase family 2 protein [Atopobiaceae bacterium]|jgi:glycosyltransferase involved in cell wall biosynthesis|nr:glycosyltransferase family 2 protein [Atopobiaceae bacterium]MCH4180103.1 glycosyltransferase family 2 protein [Atopobiaceae bacterium]MCH4213845.1 glycosyltransferase family 2 protein [Atopobiaceae bacterium]MCH4229947.1 glycosyltransferase family 2 protein [Atopobiaceae bacterium]MCH4275692.1 glycosyltransferase family 2 protein [Atopobiaceae bacterium]